MTTVLWILFWIFIGISYGIGLVFTLLNNYDDDSNSNIKTVLYFIVSPIVLLGMIVMLITEWIIDDLKK